MDFEETRGGLFPKVFGYILMYFIFTTILYFILRFFDKLPESWIYLHVMTITLTIILVGKLLRLWLK